jgi:imidazoleglycerol-phosphate dehydratase/histidinol-phosphatase
MKKRALFIDRDGTIIEEPKPSLQVDNLDQLVFLPKVIRNLYFIRKKLDFEFIMVSNQDGLGTDAYPTENFERVQNKMLQILQNEGICFDAIHIDPSLPEQNSPGRKPGTAMLTSYMDGSYDLAASFVIGDRMTDVQLAHNLGCKCILLNEEINLQESKEYAASCVMQSTDWDKISAFLFAGQRKVSVERKTKETEVKLELDLDGSGKTNIDTGIKFFDHMLDQIGRHSGCDLSIIVKGDLEVDEHHTVEDTALVLGEALRQALGDKRGIERYGYCLPMDDSLCSLALDFGGRPWLVWDVKFQREKLGELPTELIFHFFKSLSDSAKMNLNIKALGNNEHHKSESIFKAFALALKMAIRRDIYRYDLPSTKGLL